jgi:very-short-patch-repair endonuclease
VKIHWTNLIEAAGASCSVQVLDAVAHSVMCQAPRAAIATIDSALHQGFVEESQLAELFATLPARFRPLLPLVDGRAESGPETLVRLMARTLGCAVAIQVEFDGIGRVDLVLDGWLVVECDSKEFHSAWQAQVRDRERDTALAARGFSTLRLTAATIMYRPDDAFAALKGLIESRRR